MEQQFRAWLRYSLVFGFYISPTPNACKKSAQATSLSRTNHGFTCSLQRLKKLYLYVLLPWLCVLYVNGLASRKSISGTVLSWTVAMVDFSSQALSNIVMAAEGIWRQQQHETFLRLLHEIEFSLRLRLRLDIKLDVFLPRVRQLLRFQLWLSAICVLIFVYNFIKWQYIGYFWYSIWFAIAMRLRLIQLLIYVCVLRHYMRCLCLKLQQLVAYRMAPSQQLLDVNYEKLQTLAYLLAIKDIYDLLYKAFELLNAFAGWSLFSIIFCYMLDYGCTLYWALLSWEGYLERRNYYVACFWWLLPMTIIIWHLCYLCHNCKQLDRLIASMLCRIIVVNSSQSMCAYRMLLQQFSTQLQLQCIEVTARNFFTLNIRLIMSIFTCIATYLVIIIQFLNI
ncbi:uncharacterized protein LOC126759135 [Bactrocera neohumeralis]|uniref:uncharacterized protein LOC126759135 n=1 Tax=Bactrocera neohumeralis TaxID=98809 RepID=UPI00216693FE|nr:uncharacterized protein LOC126759135 [Bactrocera neohumeralis]